MTYRPQNLCHDCGYTWFPRGKDLSRRCPGCGSTAVDFAPLPPEPQIGGCVGALLLLGCGVVLLILIGVAGLASRARPTAPASVTTPPSHIHEPLPAPSAQPERPSSTPSPRTAQAVTIVLKNGRTITGELVEDDPSQLVVRVDQGTISVSRETVASYDISTRNVDASPGPAVGSYFRIPSWRRCFEAVAAQAWARDLKEIPATVIDTGIMQHVPYKSFRSGDGVIELNVYGDPDAPAGVEIGIVDPSSLTEANKAACAQVIAELLPDEEDGAIVRRLSLVQDLQRRDGLVFDVTAPTASDAYGAWWVSVYSERGLYEARAKPEELSQISHASTAHDVDWSRQDLEVRRRRPASTASTRSTGSRPETTPVALPSDRVYVRGYQRRDGTYVRPHTRRRPRR